MRFDIGWLLVGVTASITVGLATMAWIVSRWVPTLGWWLKQLAIVVLLISFGAILGASATQWLMAKPELPITIAPPVRA